MYSFRMDLHNPASSYLIKTTTATAVDAVQTRNFSRSDDKKKHWRANVPFRCLWETQAGQVWVGYGHVYLEARKFSSILSHSRFTSATCIW